MNRQLFNHTGNLVSFILRRDRIRISVWILSIVGTNMVMPYEMDRLYTSPGELRTLAESMNNPAYNALFGRAYGLDHFTTGTMFGYEMLLFSAIAVAIMNIFLVVRHPRKDEEFGRIEMIRSLPVGRLSNLSATLLSAVIVNIVLALSLAFGLYATGVKGVDLEGSLLFGAVLGAVGLLYAAAAALFSQIADTSAGAVSYSFIFLGVSYLLRAVGDVGNETFALLSPLG